MKCINISICVRQNSDRPRSRPVMGECAFQASHITKLQYTTDQFNTASVCYLTFTTHYLATPTSATPFHHNLWLKRFFQELPPVIDHITNFHYPTHPVDVTAFVFCRTVDTRCWNCSSDEVLDCTFTFLFNFVKVLQFCQHCIGQIAA